MISIISDSDSWINNYKSDFINKISLLTEIPVIWIHEIDAIKKGEICFLLGCSQIMPTKIMNLNKINLVVHESDPPKGKGWSPMSWQILEGKNSIPVTLMEVSGNIDSGQVFLKDVINFNGDELIDDIRNAQANCTIELCLKFIKKYPSILTEGKKQKGKSTFYKRRSSKDSELEFDQSIKFNFNKLRIVDNEKYPAFFKFNGNKYQIKIKKI